MSHSNRVKPGEDQVIRYKSGSDVTPFVIDVLAGKVIPISEHVIEFRNGSYKNKISFHIPKKCTFIDWFLPESMRSITQVVITKDGVMCPN
jgi:hypothetical protein